jgi:FAD synthase
MNSKLRKILDDAEQISNEELQEVYMKKEMGKIYDEISFSDIDELKKEIDTDIVNLELSLKQ